MYWVLRDERTAKARRPKLSEQRNEGADLRTKTSDHLKPTHNFALSEMLREESSPDYARIF
jgi:hypothetical protein